MNAVLSGRIAKCSLKEDQSSASLHVTDTVSKKILFPICLTPVRCSQPQISYSEFSLQRILWYPGL